MPEKQYTVYVNSREKVVAKHKLTFDEVVALAYDPVPGGEGVRFTIEYEKAHGNKDGSVTQGETMTLQDGMRILVTHTNRS